MQARSAVRCRSARLSEAVSPAKSARVAIGLIVVKSVANGARGTSDIEGKMTRVGANECGQGMSFKICDGVLSKPQIKSETKLPSATPTASNGAEGSAT